MTSLPTPSRCLLCRILIVFLSEFHHALSMTHPAIKDETSSFDTGDSAGSLVASGES